MRVSALLSVALIAALGLACQAARAASAGDDLFVSGRIPRLNIQIPEAGMETLRSYVWEKTLNGQDRTNVLATVREGDLVYTNVAVHLKGGLGSFRSVDDKPGLTLTFDGVEPSQRFHGLHKIYLNNSVQDPSYLSEKICREMFFSAGIPAPRTGHALVHLNERNLGLYVLVEGWNKQFLKQHFPDVRGNLYDGGYGNDVTNRLEINCGSFPGDWSRLEALTQAAQEPDLKQRLARMGAVLDLDHFITFMAMEVLLCHWDGYTMNKNNFRIFEDRASGRLVFLPHGMDQMFGVFRSTPTSAITPHMKALVSRAVMEVPEGRQRYFERMSQLLTNVFKMEILSHRLQELADEVRPALRSDPESQATFPFAVKSLATRMAQRAESVANQLRAPKPPLAFGPNGEVKLTDWKPQRDSGSPTFSSPLLNGKKVLRIGASGAPGYGSWRTTVLLAEGEYEFVGNAQIRNLELGPGVTRGGVTLRMSGERAAIMVTEARDWRPIKYKIRMPGLAEIELVCEFRGSNGQVIFELDSLRLVRKNDRAAPPPEAPQ